MPSGVTAFEFTVTVEAHTALWAPPESVSNTGGTGGGSPKVRVRTLAGSAGGVRGFLDGIATQARFSHAGGVAADGMGNVYIADRDNNAIRRIGAEGTVRHWPGPLQAIPMGRAQRLNSITPPASPQAPGSLSMSPTQATTAFAGSARVVW